MHSYNELSEVERSICQLKDVIEMRPIFHRTDRRVQAHLFVVALAFLLDRALEKKLKAAGLDDLTTLFYRFWKAGVVRRSAVIAREAPEHGRN